MAGNRLVSHAAITDNMVQLQRKKDKREKKGTSRKGKVDRRRGGAETVGKEERGRGQGGRREVGEGARGKGVLPKRMKSGSCHHRVKSCGPFNGRRKLE